MGLYCGVLWWTKHCVYCHVSWLKCHCSLHSKFMFVLFLCRFMSVAAGSVPALFLFNQRKASIHIPLCQDCPPKPVWGLHTSVLSVLSSVCLLLLHHVITSRAGKKRRSIISHVLWFWFFFISASTLSPSIGIGTTPICALLLWAKVWRLSTSPQPVLDFTFSLGFNANVSLTRVKVTKKLNPLSEH